MRQPWWANIKTSLANKVLIISFREISRNRKENEIPGKE